MSQLAVIKKRSARRNREGGAVIFIVSMTLALLAAVGGFAMMSASNEARTSGYERRAMQSQYLAEYAFLATANNLTADIADEYKLISLDSTRRSQGCTNLRNVPGGASDQAKACARIGQRDMTSFWVAPSDVALVPKSGTTPGSLGLTAPNTIDSVTSRPLGLDFFVELSEPTEIQVQTGFSMNGQTQNFNWCALRFTVDAFGITRSDIATGTNDTQYFGAQGVAVSHGQITSPPRMCQ